MQRAKITRSSSIHTKDHKNSFQRLMEDESSEMPIWLPAEINNEAQSQRMSNPFGKISPMGIQMLLNTSSVCSDPNFRPFPTQRDYEDLIESNQSLQDRVDFLEKENRQLKKQLESLQESQRLTPSNSVSTLNVALPSIHELEKLHYRPFSCFSQPPSCDPFRDQAQVHVQCYLPQSTQQLLPAETRVIEHYENYSNDPSTQKYQLKLTMDDEQKYSGIPIFLSIEMISNITKVIDDQISGIMIKVFLYDGEKREVTHLIKDFENSRFVAVHQGKGKASIKINEPSSKHGGKFFFGVRMCDESKKGIAVEAFTKEFIVKSRRAKGNKKPESKLTGEDSVKEMPGIGEKYARKFAEMNFRTIADLANNLGSDECDPKNNLKLQECLKVLRKHDGTKEAALSMDELLQWIKTAKAIVQKNKENMSNSDSETELPQQTKLLCEQNSSELHPSKRTKIEIDDEK
eukprot:c18321_g1_i2.p1 GENE.c18321_g1_i2~~c18321_g1_i2.p1  ORF type:complete len:460 (-),score=153.29 c18321_g1_i2:74-1453(-)